MVQSAIGVADRGRVAPAVAATFTEGGDDLLKLFGAVPDGRSGQGRDHPVTAVLALTVTAVVAWMKGAIRRSPGGSGMSRPRCWRTCTVPAGRRRAGLADQDPGKGGT